MWSVETWLLYATDCNPTTASPQTMESAIQNKVSHALIHVHPPPPTRASACICQPVPPGPRVRRNMSRREPAACASPPPPLFASPPPPPAAPATAATLNALRFAAAAATPSPQPRARGTMGHTSRAPRLRPASPSPPAGSIGRAQARSSETQEVRPRRRRCGPQAGRRWVRAGERRHEVVRQVELEGGTAGGGGERDGRRGGARRLHIGRAACTRARRAVPPAAPRAAPCQLEPDPREITESRRSRRSREMEEREKMEERQIEWRSKGDRTTCRRRRRALAEVKRGHARGRTVRRYRLLEAAAADPL